MGHPSTGACFMWGKERKADLGLSEVASFVRLGMGPASDREAVLLGFQGTGGRTTPLWLALQKDGVFSSASQGYDSLVQKL